MKIKISAMKDEENTERDEYLVRVRAQVMTRDDSSGGWVPMGGGGLSEVAVHKRPIINPNPPPDTTDHDHDRELALALALQYEYLIFGQRISDKKVVFSCIIKRDFEYNKVMPTFHHWKTGDCKFGLTFQAAADARAFDKGVRTAVEELLEALPPAYWPRRARELVQDSDTPLAAGPSRFLRLLRHKQFQYQYRAVDLLAAAARHQPSATQPFYMGMEGLSGSSAPHIYNTDVDDDDVFMTLNLPVERGDSRSSSDSSGRAGSNNGNSRHPTPPSEHPQYTHPHATHHHLHRINYMNRSVPPANNGYDIDKQSGPSSNMWLKATSNEGKAISPDKEFQDGSGMPIGIENYSYVQLTAVHEYTYPTMEEQRGGVRGLSTRRESNDSFKKLSGSGGIHEPLSPQQPPLPVKTSGRKKSRFGESPQRTRSCRYCQKPFTLDINPKGSCIFAPDTMGKFVDRVSCIEAARCMTYHCSSDREGNLEQQTCKCGMPGQEGCCLRWFGLGLLSLFLPCLCLYPPLKACHWCGRQCGICGGRHAELN